MFDPNEEIIDYEYLEFLDSVKEHLFQERLLKQYIQSLLEVQT